MQIDDEKHARLTALQAKYADYLMQYPHVVGVGIGFAQKDGEVTDELCLVVMVNEKINASALSTEEMLPQEIDGIRIDVQSTGHFGAELPE